MNFFSFEDLSFGVEGEKFDVRYIYLRSKRVSVGKGAEECPFVESKLRATGRSRFSSGFLSGPRESAEAGAKSLDFRLLMESPLQPISPDPNCEESMKIYRQHEEVRA